MKLYDWCIQNNRIDLLEQWDYEKNQKGPKDVTYGSTKSVFWRCSVKPMHVWNASPNIRTNQMTGCPFCSGHRVMVGDNDLKSLRPDIAELWDYEKNYPITPDMVTVGSNKKYWWKCFKCGFSSMTKVNHKTIEGTKCPVCANQIVIPGFNDLATTNKELLGQWDYARNKIQPNQIIEGSHRKAWWLCANGHSWEAVISSRSRGNGCPYCSNQKLLVGYNDLQTLFPAIEKYWDFEKNDKNPSEYIGKKTQKSAWFKCEKNHSWKAKIADFTSGERCPVCINKKIIKGVNDIFTTHPHLKDEWDYSNNTLNPDTVSFGSDKKAHWVCKKGHKWFATISSRTRGCGCPYCAKEYQSSLPEKAIYFYIKKVFTDASENVVLEDMEGRELDIYIPSSKIAIEYDGANWHKKVRDDLIKDNLCESKGIRLIRVREEGCPSYDSSSLKIECPRSHSGIDAFGVYVKEVFRELGGMLGITLDVDVDTVRDLTEITDLLLTMNKENSIGIVSPELLKEWNAERNGNLTPELFSYSSNKKVWWKCDKGHEWQAVIQSRTGNRSNGCPYCANQKVLVGYNDLATTFSEIAKEWDSDKNGAGPESVVGKSNKKVWWLCEKGHSYQANVSLRTIRKSKCPFCSGLKAIPGENDVKTLYPSLMKEWMFDKNTIDPSSLLPGSEKKVWWKCIKCGNEWETQVSVRARIGCGCPKCYRESRKRNK